MKKGFKLPRPIMANGDLARLINSDEVQSVVKPQKASGKHAALKKNPLRNLGALLKLNPYAKAARRAELLGAAAKAKARKLDAARAQKKESKKVRTQEGGACARVGTLCRGAGQEQALCRGPQNRVLGRAKLNEQPWLGKPGRWGCEKAIASAPPTALMR